MFKTPRILGGIVLVSGTSIGAGMLAFPLVTLKIGLVWSFLIMAGFCSFMYISAIYTARVMLAFHKNTAYPLPVIAQKMKCKTMAFWGHLITIILFYALMVAYIVGGTSILKTFLGVGDTPLMIGFCIIFGTFIVGEMHHLDMMNRFLFLILTLIFFCIILNLKTNAREAFPHIDWKMKNMALSIPIFFTAFGFHGSIPSVIKLVGTNIKHLKKVFFVGSLFPLFVYLAWQYTTFMAFPDEQRIVWLQADQENLGQFLYNMGIYSNFSHLKVFTSIFGFIAIVTSFLGVGVGLCDYMQALVGSGSEAIKTLKLFGLVISVPLGLAILYPQAFLGALSFSALMLCGLVVFLPIYLGRKLNFQDMRGSEWLMFIMATVIIGAEILYRIL